MVALDENLVDSLWNDKPKVPLNSVKSNINESNNKYWKLINIKFRFLNMNHNL